MDAQFSLTLSTSLADTSAVASVFTSDAFTATSTRTRVRSSDCNVVWLHLGAVMCSGSSSHCNMPLEQPSTGVEHTDYEMLPHVIKNAEPLDFHTQLLEQEIPSQSKSDDFYHNYIITHHFTPITSCNGRLQTSTVSNYFASGEGSWQEEPITRTDESTLLSNQQPPQLSCMAVTRAQEISKMSKIFGISNACNDTLQQKSSNGDVQKHSKEVANFRQIINANELARSSDFAEQPVQTSQCLDSSENKVRLISKMVELTGAVKETAAQAITSDRSTLQHQTNASGPGLDIATCHVWKHSHRKQCKTKSSRPSSIQLVDNQYYSLPIEGNSRHQLIPDSVCYERPLADNLQQFNEIRLNINNTVESEDRSSYLADDSSENISSDSPLLNKLTCHTAKQSENGADSSNNYFEYLTATHKQDDSWLINKSERSVLLELLKKFEAESSPLPISDEQSMSDGNFQVLRDDQLIEQRDDNSFVLKNKVKSLNDEPFISDGANSLPFFQNEVLQSENCGAFTKNKIDGPKMTRSQRSVLSSSSESGDNIDKLNITRVSQNTAEDFVLSSFDSFDRDQEQDQKQQGCDMDKYFQYAFSLDNLSKCIRLILTGMDRHPELRSSLAPFLKSVETLMVALLKQLKGICTERNLKLSGQLEHITRYISSMRSDSCNGTDSAIIKTASNITKDYNNLFNATYRSSRQLYCSSQVLKDIYSTSGIDEVSSGCSLKPTIQKEFETSDANSYPWFSSSNEQTLKSKAPGVIQQLEFHTKSVPMSDKRFHSSGISSKIQAGLSNPKIPASIGSLIKAQSNFKPGSQQRRKYDKSLLPKLLDEQSQRKYMQPSKFCSTVVHERTFRSHFSQQQLVEEMFMKARQHWKACFNFYVGTLLRLGQKFQTLIQHQIKLSTTAVKQLNLTDASSAQAYNSDNGENMSQQSGGKLLQQDYSDWSTNEMHYRVEAWQGAANLALNQLELQCKTLHPSLDWYTIEAKLLEACELWEQIGTAVKLYYQLQYMRLGDVLEQNYFVELNQKPYNQLHWQIRYKDWCCDVSSRVQLVLKEVDKERYFAECRQEYSEEAVVDPNNLDTSNCDAPNKGCGEYTQHKSKDVMQQLRTNNNSNNSVKLDKIQELKKQLLYRNQLENPPKRNFGQLLDPLSQKESNPCDYIGQDADLNLLTYGSEEFTTVRQ